MVVSDRNKSFFNYKFTLWGFWELLIGEEANLKISRNIRKRFSKFDESKTIFVVELHG